MSWLKKTTGISISTPDLPSVQNPRDWVRPQDLAQSIGDGMGDFENWGRERGRVFDEWARGRGRLFDEWSRERARIFGEWSQERLEVARRWLIEQGLHLWLEPPHFVDEDLVNPGNFGGDPVVWVNGIMNTKYDARSVSAKYLSYQIERPVLLLYNPSSHPRPDGDLYECFLDKKWLPPLPQHNATTRQLAYLMYEAGGKLSLVTHSQGCIIAQNAILTMWFLGKEAWVRNSLAWVAAAPPVPPPWIKPAKHEAFVKSGDSAPQMLGLRGGDRWYKINMVRHSFVRMEDGIDNRRTGASDDFSGFQVRHPDTGRPLPGKTPNDYLAMVEALMLWPAGGQDNGQRFYEKHVRLVNASTKEVNIDYSLERFNVGQERWEWYDGSRVVPPKYNGSLDLEGLRGRSLRFRARSTRHSWDRWSEPIEMAPRDGYLGDGIGTFTLTLQSPSTPTVRAWNGFATQMMGYTTRTRFWHNVTDKSGHRSSSEGMETFERSEFPWSPRGAFDGDFGPFASSEEIERTCYCFRRVWPEDSRLWLVPKSAAGEVWTYDLNEMAWSREGFLTRYQRPTGAPNWEGDLDLDTTLPNLQQYAQELRNSMWRTEYVALDGSLVSATLYFEGNSGRYALVNSRYVGRLSNVTYQVHLNDSVRISGQWQLGGSAGFFVFKIDDDERLVFQGEWGTRIGQTLGTWNGFRVMVDDNVSGGGPAPIDGLGGGVVNPPPIE